MKDTAALVTLAICALIFPLLRLYIKALKSSLHAIPTVGHSGVLTSYITAVKYLFFAHELLQEVYDKYHGEAFKVATIARWIVVVSGPQMVDDIRKANDKQMSFREAVAETIQSDYMIGPQIRTDPYHIGVVRTPLTRNLGARFSDIKDEIAAAFADLVPVKEHGKIAVVSGFLPKLVSVLRLE